MQSASCDPDCIRSRSGRLAREPRRFAARSLLSLLSALCGLLIAARPSSGASAVSVAGSDPAKFDAAASAPPLELENMTFVGSRSSAREMVVEAARARFLPGAQIAYLEEVRTQLEATEGKTGFSMSCDRGELRTDTNDFHAIGHVTGTTGDGRHFATDWVRYEHKTGLAWTDAPVLVDEKGGRYRGGGFRYHVRDQRFRFVGGASLVRE